MEISNLKNNLTISISYKPKEEEIKIIKKELESISSLFFLYELDNDKRIEVLKNTDILVTFFPEKELSKTELEILKNSKKIKISTMYIIWDRSYRF